MLVYNIYIIYIYICPDCMRIGYNYYDGIIIITLPRTKSPANNGRVLIGTANKN